MHRLSEGLILAVFSIIAIWGAWQIPAASAGDTWAGIVPMAAAIMLLLLAGFLILGAIGQSDDSGDSSVNKKVDHTETGFPFEIIILFLLALLYQQSFNWFGYLIPTALIAPVLFYLFGVRSRLGLSLSVVLCPLAFHLVFFELLGVFPPFGEVFDLLSVIKG